MSQLCRHPSHSNPALMFTCPECGQDWKYVSVPDFVLERASHDATEIDSIRAENRRLREVLRKGYELITGDLVGVEWKKGCSEWRRLVRTALEDSSPTQPEREKAKRLMRRVRG